MFALAPGAPLPRMIAAQAALRYQNAALRTVSSCCSTGIPARLCLSAFGLEPLVLRGGG